MSGWVRGVIGCSLSMAVLAGASEPVAGIEGLWALAIESGDRVVERRLEVRIEAEGPRGTLNLGGGDLPLESATWVDNVLGFELSQTTPRGERRFRFEGRLEGESLIGTISGPHGKSACTGRRGGISDSRPGAPRHHAARAKAGRSVAAVSTPPPEESPAPPPGTLIFRARNQRYSAEGRFERWRFREVSIPDGDVTRGRVVIEVELASVWEKASSLADHLRTADFFDVERHPLAMVTIANAKAKAGGGYTAVAEIDLHGVKAPVDVEFELSDSSPARITGTAVLPRSLFGIGSPIVEGNASSVEDGVGIELSATLPGVK